MSTATLTLALLSGLLSTLSPCVLPLLPIVVGTAASRHRAGPVALAAGLAVGFVAIGLFVATIGYSVGLDTGVFRIIAAMTMVALGVVLLVPKLQTQVAAVAMPAANRAAGHLSEVSDDGWRGQFMIGLLLGAVWSPCVGPTLGAASVLAAQGRDLGHVALTMAMFGIGAALPLLLLGLLSRDAMLRLRSGMMSAGHIMKSGLAAILIVIGLAVITGLDKSVEARLVAAMPAWLTDLTTRF